MAFLIVQLTVAKSLRILQLQNDWCNCKNKGETIDIILKFREKMLHHAQWIMVLNEALVIGDSINKQLTRRLWQGWTCHWKSWWLQSFPNTESGKQGTEMNSQDKGLSKQGTWSVCSKSESHKDAVQEQSRIITHAVRAAMLFLFVSAALQAVSWAILVLWIYTREEVKNTCWPQCLGVVLFGIKKFPFH